VQIKIPMLPERPSLRPLRSPAKRVLVILAPTEADVPPVRQLARRLRARGVEVSAASECHGDILGERRHVLSPNLLLVEAAEREWDAVILAGGRGALRVAEDQFARQVVAGAAARGKPLAALGLGRAVADRASLRCFSSPSASPSQARRATVDWLCAQLDIAHGPEG
jgi:putative intracellular protease/amidase